jgi:hypothetical protein
MQFRKGHGELSVIEAVNHLSNMAELDLTVPKEKTVAMGHTDEQISEKLHGLSWHDPAYYSYNQERVKETFQILFKYMQELYEKDKGQLRDAETQRGIQALMLLAGEAAQKIDKFTQIFQGESVTELKEFKELQHFYLTKVVQRFQTLPEAEEKWAEEWGTGEEGQALIDLESVRRDKNYELFLIRKEDGRPYFNKVLLHHLQLVGQFENLLVDGEKEGLFSRIEMIQDREVHTSAKEILGLASAYLDEYFKESLKFKQMGFVSSINKAVMGLMLAANSRNLISNTTGKSSLQYYADFHRYLRQALTSSEYLRFMAHPPGHAERFLHKLINLSHVLCASFFLRMSSRKDMVAFIRMLIEKGAKGSETQSQTSSPLSLWNTLIDYDQNIRHLLKLYPNGPLMKALQLFQNDVQLSGFDPIRQQNWPGQIYTLFGQDIHVSCIRLASPTSQQLINQAQVIEEFTVFLRNLGPAGKNQRYLLIDLQDRTSWHEHARCTALEEVQKNSELAHSLVVVTLPKNTDFYFQAGSYFELNNAQEFIQQFEEQIASGPQCGFYFPTGLDLKEIKRFSQAALQTIHTLFFAGKETLLHKNRLDFIEIFYMLFILKLIEMVQPDLLSFTCKDGVDTGAAANAELFSLLRMMNDRSNWSKQEQDFLLWMIYASSLSMRQRAMDFQRFERMVSALAVINAEIEAQHEQTTSACSKLFSVPFFKDFKVKESTRE